MPALLLKLVGLLSSGWGLVKAVFAGFIEWLFADFRHMVITGLALFALVFWLRLGWVADARDGWRESAELNAAALAHSQLAHFTFVMAVQEARQAAAAEDLANAQRVEREMTANQQRTADEYEALIARRDAALERLRRELELVEAAGDAASGGGGGRATDVPRDLAARCQAFGAADCDQLLAALPDTLSAAEENTAKLIGLQEYVRGLLSIDLTGERLRQEQTVD